MKKKLNIDAITNELEGASLFFARPPLSKAGETEKKNVPVAKEPERSLSPTPLTPGIKKSEETSSKRQTNKETIKVNQPVDQSTSQSTDQSTNTQISDIDALGSIVDRPKAFYITEQVDRWLDEAVLYLQNKGIHKADRSILLNALIHDPSLFEEKALDSIRNKLLLHMTNRSMKRR